MHEALEPHQERAGHRRGRRSWPACVNLLPTSVVVRIARQQAETVDFTTSNVRAAPFDLYIAGAHIEATYPLGPLAGSAFNLTMMSYRGWLNMGLHLDTGAVTEPELLRDHLVEAFAELHRRRLLTLRADRTTSGHRCRSGDSGTVGNDERPRRTGAVRADLWTDQLAAAPAASSSDTGSSRGGGQQRADVEEQVGDLVGRHQLSMCHVPEALVDDRKSFVDHVKLVGLRHLRSDRGGMSVTTPSSVPVNPTCTFQSAFPATHCSDTL